VCSTGQCSSYLRSVFGLGELRNKTTYYFGTTLTAIIPRVLGGEFYWKAVAAGANGLETGIIKWGGDKVIKLIGIGGFGQEPSQNALDFFG
jgi:hypothetical protein